MLLLVLLVVGVSALPNYNVKFIYIVPEGKTPRSNINTTMTNLISDLQRFFTIFLQRNFEISYPLFDIVSSHSVTDIKNGTYLPTWARDESRLTDIPYQTYLNMFYNVVSDRSMPYYEGRHVSKDIMFAITEINEWVAVGGAGLVSVGGRELDKYRGDQSVENLYPFDHEFGHALGLEHSRVTFPCLDQQNLSYTTEYTFMTAIDLADYVNCVGPCNNLPAYAYNVEDYEKKLLLGLDGYTEECLLTLIDRPHPSNYLSICSKSADLTENTVIDVEDLSILLTNWGKCQNNLDCPSDLNCDYTVNIVDLSTLLVDWS